MIPVVIILSNEVLLCTDFMDIQTRAVFATSDFLYKKPTLAQEANLHIQQILN